MAVFVVFDKSKRIVASGRAGRAGTEPISKLLVLLFHRNESWERGWRWDGSALTEAWRLSC